MADGNELDDDLDEDSVEFTPEEDGVIGFVLPRVGFPTVEQQKWADSITRELMSARTENRVLRSQVDNANRLAAETSAVLGEVIYADSDESLEEAEPLRAPSKPLVTSRMGNLEILWDGNDFEGGPMPASTTGVNVYAVKTSEVPADADFTLRTPYDDGLVEEDPDAEMPPQGVVIPLAPTPTPATVWPPTSIGTILPSSTGSNVIFSDLEYNEEYTVWLMAVDPLGTTGEPSERVLSSVQPLVDTDIIGQIIAGANIVDGSITASDKIIGNTITGALIQALAIDAGHLQANSVIADKIAVGALDGKLITGAIIRTAATGVRVQLDSVGLRTFNGANAVTASLTSGDGGLLLTGSIISTTTTGGQVDTATLGLASLQLRTTSGEAWWSMGLSSSGLSANGNQRTPIGIWHNSNAPGSDVNIGAVRGNVTISAPEGMVSLLGEVVRVKNSWNTGYQELGSMTTYNAAINRAYFGGGNGQSPTAAGQSYIALNNGSITGASSIASITNNGTEAFAVTADGGLSMPKMPYAMATGSVSSAATGGGSTASFPSGRFRATPRIQLTVTSTTNNVVAVPWFNGVSSSSITGIRIFTLGGGQVAGTVEWLAVQMTTSAGSG